MKEIFQKEYTGEELNDVQRDVIEAFDKRFNPEVKNIPSDKYGMAEGTFIVTIEWKAK